MQKTLFEIDLLHAVHLHAVEDKEHDCIILYVKGEGETSLYEWGNQSRVNSREELYKTMENIAHRTINKVAVSSNSRVSELTAEPNVNTLRQFLLEHRKASADLLF